MVKVIDENDTDYVLLHAIVTVIYHCYHIAFRRVLLVSIITIVMIIIIADIRLPSIVLYILCVYAVDDDCYCGDSDDGDYTTSFRK